MAFKVNGVTVINDSEGAYFSGLTVDLGDGVHTLGGPGSGPGWVTLTPPSDYRLKTDVRTLNPEQSSSRLMSLRPVSFHWVDEERGTQLEEGFIAHEADSVVPHTVTGEYDAVDENGNPIYQRMDYAKVVPILTSALQDAIMKIEELEDRIRLLERNT